jgi:hypothetical protein
MGAGVAICEDKDGNRRCFSIRLLTPATPEQIKATFPEGQEFES